MADSPAPAPIPIICDRCRARGIPGAPPSADLGDLLDFAPVPRRPRVGGWANPHEVPSPPTPKPERRP